MKVKGYLIHTIESVFIYSALSVYRSMPTGFFIWGYMYPFTFIFGGTSKFYPSFGGTKKINCIFSTQGRAPCCFCKYYAVGENFFFLSDIWSDRKWGSVWPMAFVSVPPFFCNIAAIDWESTVYKNWLNGVYKVSVIMSLIPYWHKPNTIKLLFIERKIKQWWK
jgi:hypothetical protein